MAGHSNAKTTGLYGRRNDNIIGGGKWHGPGTERTSQTKVLPCNMRNRARDVVNSVCKDLRLSPTPEVVWIRPVTADAALEILNRCKHAYENGIPPAGSIPPVRCFVEGDIRQGFTPFEPTNEIWIRSDLSHFLALEFIAAHETRHVWQNQPKTKSCMVIDAQQKGTHIRTAMPL